MTWSFPQDLVPAQNRNEPHGSSKPGQHDHNEGPLFGSPPQVSQG